MTVRKLFPLAVAFGLWAAGPAAAQRKSARMSAEEKAKNQKLADDVAAKLKSSGAVPKGAKVDIRAWAGSSTCPARSRPQEQHDEILEGPEARSRASSGSKAASWSATSRRSSGLAARAKPAGPAAVESAAATDAVVQPGFTAAGTIAAACRLGRQAGGSASVYRQRAGPAERHAGHGPGRSGRPAAAAVRLADLRPVQQLLPRGYPQTYPYNAFPFIGPFYPFPKVPLGWRKVVLEWEDGHWYYGKLVQPRTTTGGSSSGDRLSREWRVVEPAVSGLHSALATHDSPLTCSSPASGSAIIPSCPLNPSSAPRGRSRSVWPEFESRRNSSTWPRPSPTPSPPQAPDGRGRHRGRQDPSPTSSPPSRRRWPTRTAGSSSPPTPSACRSSSSARTSRSSSR